MLRKIEDIRRSVENGSFLSALALALTLPDICSMVGTASSKSSKRAYINWVNQHLYPFFEHISVLGAMEFNGDVCYSLRCCFLHSGSLDVENTEIGDMNYKFILKKPGIEKFSHHIEFPTNTYTLTIDIGYLCWAICRACGDFYNAYPDKSKFADHTCVIEE